MGYSQLVWHAEDVALTTNQNFVRDFPVAYDILFENISDQVICPLCME
jgi:hypothetical protein